MGSGIEAAQIGKVQVQQVSLAIRTFLNSVVVKHYQVTVTAHVNVQFDGINGKRECIAKCGQGILWGKVGAATMGDSLHGFRHSSVSVSFRCNKVLLYSMATYIH